MRRGASLQAVDDRLLGTMDVRKEVSDLECLAVGGVFQLPQGTAGQVGVGDMDTSTDIFVWPDPTTMDDFPGPGRGQPTSF